MWDALPALFGFVPFVPSLARAMVTGRRDRALMLERMRAGLDTAPADGPKVRGSGARVMLVAAVAAGYLEGGDPGAIFRMLAHAVLREDAGFHHYQQIDIVWRRMQRGRDVTWSLIATARWLAAH